MWYAREVELQDIFQEQVLFLFHVLPGAKTQAGQLGGGCLPSQISHWPFCEFCVKTRVVV